NTTSFGRQIKIALRTDARSEMPANVVRTEIAAIDRQLAIESILTMDARVAEVVAPRRFSTITLGAFATGSLLLAAVGLYGLLAFNVVERRREIAVRVALGAESRSILWMVVRQGLRLVVIGMGVGLAVSYGGTRVLASLLYQTGSYDLVTFASLPLFLLLIALVACLLPAYWATRVAPITALRE